MTTAKRLNKHDLAANLAASGAFDSKKEALEAILSVTSEISKVMVSGDTVAIPDFGKFEAYTRQNGVVKPKFTPFATLKEAVAG